MNVLCVALSSSSHIWQSGAALPSGFCFLLSTLTSGLRSTSRLKWLEWYAKTKCILFEHILLICIVHDMVVGIIIMLELTCYLCAVVNTSGPRYVISKHCCNKVVWQCIPESCGGGRNYYIHQITEHQLPCYRHPRFHIGCRNGTVFAKKKSCL